MFGFSGCGGKKYKVDYNGRKDVFENAKDYYRAGQKVEVWMKFIATDTDYAFYLDGQRLNPDYSERKGYIISFTMPAHDVRLTYSARNSMVYDPDPKREDYVVLEYSHKVFTAEGDRGYTVTLSTCGEDSYLLEKSEDDETTSWQVSYRVVMDCNRIIKDEKLREWQYLEEYDCLDGATTSCKMRNDDGSYTVASTNKMPSDGEKSLSLIYKALSKYMTDENLK